MQQPEEKLCGLGPNDKLVVRLGRDASEFITGEVFDLANHCNVANVQSIE